MTSRRVHRSVRALPSSPQSRNGRYIRTQKHPDTMAPEARVISRLCSLLGVTFAAQNHDLTPPAACRLLPRVRTPPSFRWNMMAFTPRSAALDNPPPLCLRGRFPGSTAPWRPHGGFRCRARVMLRTLRPSPVPVVRLTPGLGATVPRLQDAGPRRPSVGKEEVEYSRLAHKPAGWLLSADGSCRARTDFPHDNQRGLAMVGAGDGAGEGRGPGAVVRGIPVEHTRQLSVGIVERPERRNTSR